MTRQTLGSDEEFIMDAGITLNQFLAAAHQMSDEDLFIMGANLVLTSNERAEKREQALQRFRERQTRLASMNGGLAEAD